VKITYKGDYALKALLDLALHYDGSTVVSMHQLAKRLDIPNKFLEQVLLELKRGGFVASRRGKIGGYLLAKLPSRIKVGDVVRFMDGSIEPISCVAQRYKGCSDIYRCVFRKIWQDVASAITGIVDNITFEDLVRKMNRRKGTFVYEI